MLEYSALLSKNAGSWFDEALYQVATVTSSPYFWPAVVIFVVAVVFAGRLFLK